MSVFDVFATDDSRDLREARMFRFLEFPDQPCRIELTFDNFKVRIPVQDEDATVLCTRHPLDDEERQEFPNEVQDDFWQSLIGWELVGAWEMTAHFGEGSDRERVLEVPMAPMAELTGRSALLLMLVAFTACRYGKRPPSVGAGRQFDYHTAARSVKVGDSALAVLDVLGPPLAVLKENDTSRWRYYKRVNTGDDVKLLGFLPWPDSNYWHSYEAVLTTKAGVVEDVKLREWEK